MCVVEEVLGIGEYYLFILGSSKYLVINDFLLFLMYIFNKIQYTTTQILGREVWWSCGQVPGLPLCRPRAG